MIKVINKAIYSWFYLGFIPIAPGTMGTIGAIPLVIFLSGLGLYWYLLITIILLPIGCYLSKIAAKDLNNSDPKQVVVDEVAGFLITMIEVPISWKSILLGFVLFRTLDIFKPYPISFCDQKIKGGVGIMLDDVLAGIFACFLLHLLARYISF